VTATIAVVVLSGGTAWAASGGARPHVVDATDVSTSSTDSTDTTVDPSSTSSSTDTTDTTATTDTTDTTVAETTSSTVPESTTSVPAVATPEPCKPGWGYGDTNHCHSGPPGQENRQHGTVDVQPGTSGAATDDHSDKNGADQEKAEPEHADQQGAD
jgi:hypothetical protein